MIDTFHEVRLDLRAEYDPDEVWTAVAIDGQEIRGVEKVSVDAPVDGLPRVTLTLVAKRIAGPE